MCGAYHLGRIPPPPDAGAVTARRLLLALAILLLLPARAAAQGADPLLLDGDWAFRPGDDPVWAHPALDDAAWARVPVPAAWEDHVGEHDGFAWYRLPVALPDSVRAGPVGVRFGSVGDAFELYWNGVRVGASGRVGPDFLQGVQPVLFLVPDSALARARADGRHVLAVRVYNDYAYGGLIGGVAVGRFEVMAQDRSPRPVLIGALCTFFLAIGVYHLAFWLRRRAARENLRFALLCLAVTVYGATYAEAVEAMVMPVIHPYRLALLALLAAGPAYVALIRDLFGLRLRKRMRIVNAVFAVAALVSAVLPLRLLAEFNKWIDGALVIGLLAVVALAWRGRAPGTPHARTLLAGTAAFSTALAYDLLSEYFLFVPIPEVLPGVPGLFWIGFLVFVVCVGVATAGQWAVTETKAMVDPLTELSRRHVLEDAMRRETERLRRAGGSLALVMIDLDHFKRVNDTHGHAVGDQVLARVGRLLRATARNLDVPARFGGEEFAVLLYDSDVDGAVSFAERLRANLAEMRVPVPGHAVVQVTASMGVAVGAAPVDPDTLVEAADRALYRAKSAGRDRLVSVRVDGRDRIGEFVAAH